MTSKILFTPNKLPIPWKLKIALGCISKEPVMYQGRLVMVRNTPLCYHDLHHLEVAKLERIRIGKHLVSGIHGINAPELHEFPIVAEYDGILDEVRVAFHEFLVKTSVYNTFKAFLWINWLLFKGINPIAVMWRHHKSLQRFLDNSLLAAANLNDLPKE
ncbi:hypothetical protein IQ255_22715 [Pleurocapsales cyanobacterium LEGE 10410]|nr:hypothetical protein [Pleurocapsales cyanobacterium LEGE 10410]